MSGAEVLGPASTIVEATGRPNLADAVAWLGEGHPMPADTCWPRLLRALIAEAGNDADSEAVRRVTREIAVSDVDTSRLIFDPDSLPTAAEFGAALTALLSRSPDGSFGGLTPRGVMRAQRAERRAIEALCLAVGVSERDARGWFGVSSAWREPQVKELLEYLSELVDGALESPFPEAAPARALELTDGNGWETLDQLYSCGVPYGLLLAQRAVGGVWLAHKNKTSSRPNQIAADSVCAELEARGIEFKRATTAGGAARQKDLQELSGIKDKRVGMIIVDEAGRPAFAVTFSAARDGGTARANGDGLMQIPRTSLPHAVVLVGVGWAERHETDRLAFHFDGRVFSDRSIPDLADCIEESGG